MFKEETFESKKVREFIYTLKILDIFWQSSSGVLGGQESLFQIHQDNVPKEQKDIVVSIILALIDSKSKMKVVGGKDFEYDAVEKGVLFMSELWHESLSAEEGIVKISLFYEGDKAEKKSVKALKKY